MTARQRCSGGDTRKNAGSDPQQLLSFCTQPTNTQVPAWRRIVKRDTKLYLQVIQLRHMGDYQQPGVSQRQAERAVRLAREFLEILMREVFNGP